MTLLGPALSRRPILGTLSVVLVPPYTGAMPSWTKFASQIPYFMNHLTIRNGAEAKGSIYLEAMINLSAKVLILTSINSELDGV